MNYFHVGAVDVTFYIQTMNKQLLILSSSFNIK